jgi:pilus assembly protein CpaC
MTPAFPSFPTAVVFRVLSAWLLLAWLLIAPALAGTAAAVRSDDAESGQSVVLTVTKARQFTLPVDVRDVLVADPTIADVLIKTPRRVYLIANKIGNTNALFLDAAGRQVLKLDVRVDRDLEAVRTALKQLVPDADVTVASLNQDVAVSGSVPNAQTADTVRAVVRRFVDKDESIVNLMKVTGAQQVVIRLKIAEVSRKVTKELGFDLFLQGNSFTFQSGALSGLGLFSNRFGTASTVGSSLGTLNGNSAKGANIFSNGYSVTSSTGTTTSYPSGPSSSPLSGSVEALEQQGLIKILAEPNLTALSGEPASFLAGGQFPIPTSKDAQGNPVITLQPYGVSLAFTPVVLEQGRISLRINAEVSEIDNSVALVEAGFSVPGLTVRQAQTTVEIPSGGSLVLGGLLRNDASNTVNGLPGLKDIPILGTLFRSSSFLSQETEMVVIATPYVVRPTAPAALTAPTDGFAPASDLDMYLLNGLYARYGGGSKAPAAGSETGSGSKAAAAGVPPTVPDKPFGYIMP